MIVTVERFANNGNATLSLVFVDTAFECFGLEDEPRAEKVRGETRIPSGSYVTRLRTEGGMHSRYARAYPKHRGMLWLQDVPGFEWIYFHVGNTADHSDGCILVGDGVSRTDERWAVSSSRLAYERFYDKTVQAAELGDLRTVIIDRDF